MTTIIYVPKNCNNTISHNPNNAEIVIESPENTHAFNLMQNSSYSSPNVSTILNKKKGINIGHKSIEKINTTNIQNQNFLDAQRMKKGKIIINKQEKVNISIERLDNRNIVFQKLDDIAIRKTPIVKRFIKDSNTSAITICAGCGQYCKIQDNDLINIGKTNAETLAAEILLELQEVNPFNEEDRVLLTKKGIEICDKALQKQKINLMDLLTNDNELVAFTGINFELLEKITKLVLMFEGTSVKKYSSSARDRITMCLCKLRTNLPFRCLAVLFDQKQQVCTGDFFVMVKTLSTLLGKTIYWAKTEELLKNLPKCFQSFKQTRVMLHCSELEIEKQRCLKCRNDLLSNNILYETIKYVLGVAPSGLIIFKSNVFEGNENYNSIFTQTNILEKLDPIKEAIMADKSLDIESECAKQNVTLIKSPKLAEGKQFGKSDVELIKNISAARIHVDRTLQRFKMYKIIQTKISWRILPYIDDICSVIAGIVNMKNPIPPDDSLLKL